MDGRVEKIARALCILDREDPDELVLDGRVAPARQGDAVFVAATSAPRWQLKTAEAIRFLTCLDAIAPNPLGRPIQLSRGDMMGGQS